MVVKVVPMKYNDPEKVQREFSSFNDNFSIEADGDEVSD